MPHPHSKAKQRGSYFLLFRVPRSYRLFMSGPLDGGVRHPAASKTDVHLSARSFLQRSTRKSTTAQTPPTRRPGRSGQQIARPQPLRLVGEPALCIFRRCSPPAPSTTSVSLLSTTTAWAPRPASARFHEPKTSRDPGEGWRSAAREAAACVLRGALQNNRSSPKLFISPLGKQGK